MAETTDSGTLALPLEFIVGRLFTTNLSPVNLRDCLTPQTETERGIPGPAIQSVIYIQQTTRRSIVVTGHEEVQEGKISILPRLKTVN